MMVSIVQSQVLYVIPVSLDKHLLIIHLPTQDNAITKRLAVKRCLLCGANLYFVPWAFQQVRMPLPFRICRRWKCSALSLSLFLTPQNAQGITQQKINVTLHLFISCYALKSKSLCCSCDSSMQVGIVRQEPPQDICSFTMLLNPIRTVSSLAAQSSSPLDMW